MPSIHFQLSKINPVVGKTKWLDFCFFKNLDVSEITVFEMFVSQDSRVSVPPTAGAPLAQPVALSYLSLERGAGSGALEAGPSLLPPVLTQRGWCLWH